MENAETRKASNIEDTESRKENKKTKLLILLLLLLTLIAVGVTVWVLFFRDPAPHSPRTTRPSRRNSTPRTSGTMTPKSWRLPRAAARWA